MNGLYSGSSIDRGSQQLGEVIICWSIIVFKIQESAAHLEERCYQDKSIYGDSPLPGSYFYIRLFDYLGCIKGL